MTGPLVYTYPDAQRFGLWVKTYADIQETTTAVAPERTNGPDATAVIAADVTHSIQAGDTNLDIAIDMTGVGGVGERTVELHLSGTAAFTPGAATLVDTKMLPADKTELQFQTRILFPWMPTAYMQLRIKDELSDAFGDAWQVTSELTLDGIVVVYFSEIGSNPLNSALLMFLLTFEEGQGTTIKDATGNADAAVDVVGGGSWKLGPAGGAYSFGATTEINANHTTAHDVGAGGSMIIDLIARFVDGAANQYLFHHANDYWMRVNAAGDIEYTVPDHGSVTQTLGVNLNDLGLNSRWFYLKFASRVPSTVLPLCFINGVKMKVNNFTGTAHTGAIGDVLEIGHRASAEEWDGDIAYLRGMAGAVSVGDLPFLADVLKDYHGVVVTLPITAAITLQPPVGMALVDRKSTRLNSSHTDISRMPSSA